MLNELHRIHNVPWWECTACGAQKQFAFIPGGMAPKCDSCSNGNWSVVPVIPTLQITEFCRKFNQWAELLSARDEQFGEAWEIVALAIDKSNLLWRMLYAGEEARKTPCPTHKGRWSGVGPNPGCGCWSYGNITGWLAEKPENLNAPTPPVVMVKVKK